MSYLVIIEYTCYLVKILEDIYKNNISGCLYGTELGDLFWIIILKIFFQWLKICMFYLDKINKEKKRCLNVCMLSTAGFYKKNFEMLVQPIIYQP